MHLFSTKTVQQGSLINPRHWVVVRYLLVFWQSPGEISDNEERSASYLVSMEITFLAVNNQHNLVPSVVWTQLSPGARIGFSPTIPPTKFTFCFQVRSKSPIIYVNLINVYDVIIHCSHWITTRKRENVPSNFYISEIRHLVDTYYNKILSSLKSQNQVESVIIPSQFRFALYSSIQWGHEYEYEVVPVGIWLSMESNNVKILESTFLR